MVRVVCGVGDAHVWVATQPADDAVARPSVGRDVDQQSELELRPKIQTLQATLLPIQGRLQSFFGNQRGWVPVPSFHEDALSQQDAASIEFSLERLAEQSFQVAREARMDLLPDSLRGVIPLT
jgi:hypothetical protein